MPDLAGFSHLSLTVTDVDASTAWWTELMGLIKVLDGVEAGRRFTTNIHSSGVIIGFRERETEGDDQFDESRVGLDHFALHVPARADLDGWLARLDELEIEHSEIKDVAYGSVLTFRDPDNIQAEFFALPGI
ncbi:MAG: hypothetical protein QOG16_742 [Actinomycetota bacterium]|jgi:catechol 2,3-dioxygenase-like lactoylglutathione lyase family enzyme|nr:hypothetical protein [Actinomycetota bacterium]